MSAHTPGPWKKRLIEYENGEAVAWAIEAGDGRGAGYIADVHMHSDEERDDNRDEANAETMAAAPEMLEALQTTLGNLRSLKSNAFKGLATLDEWIAMVERAMPGPGRRVADRAPRTSLFDGAPGK